MNGLGDAMSANKVTEIKRQLDTGQYRIDPYAIADAMIRWAELEVESAGRRVPRAPAAQRRRAGGQAGAGVDHRGGPRAGQRLPLAQTRLRARVALVETLPDGVRQRCLGAAPLSQGEPGAGAPQRPGDRDDVPDL